MFETLLYLRANLFVCRVLAAYFSKFLLSGPLITFLETGLFTVPSPMAQFHFHTSNISFCIGATPQQVKQCQSSSPVCLSWAQTNQTCLALSTCLLHATISVWNANPLLWKQASCRVACLHCSHTLLSFPLVSLLRVSYYQLLGTHTRGRTLSSLCPLPWPLPHSCSSVHQFPLPEFSAPWDEVECGEKSLCGQKLTRRQNFTLKKTFYKHLFHRWPLSCSMQLLTVSCHRPSQRGTKRYGATTQGLQSYKVSVANIIVYGASLLKT